MDAEPLLAAAVDENEVRAAAGLTMVIGAVAFGYAYFAKQYVPLQVAASLFFVEFLVRSRLVSATARRPRRAGDDAPPEAEWVSAKPKRLPGRSVWAWRSR